MTSLKKVIKYALLLVVGLFAGVFIAGAISGVKDALSADKSDAIQAALIDHCECESVTSFIYTKGIHFSKEEGVSTETAEYELKNCTYDNLYKEVARLNLALLEEVEGYDEVDLLKLEFVGADKHETITIKNGVIQ